MKITVLKTDTKPIVDELSKLNFLLRRIATHFSINVDEVPFEFEEPEEFDRVSYTASEDSQIVEEQLGRMGK